MILPPKDGSVRPLAHLQSLRDELALEVVLASSDSHLSHKSSPYFFGPYGRWDSKETNVLERRAFHASHAALEVCEEGSRQVSKRT